MGNENSKEVMKNIGESLDSVIDYLVSDEAEDFIENIGEYHFKSEDDEEIENGIVEIEAAIEGGLSPNETLSIIEKHMCGPDHIYMSVLRLQAWMEEASTECAGEQS